MSDEDASPSIKEQTIFLSDKTTHCITLRGNSKDMYTAKDGALVFGNFSGDVIVEADGAEFFKQLMKVRGKKDSKQTVNYSEVTTKDDSLNDSNRAAAKAPAATPKKSLAATPIKSPAATFYTPQVDRKNVVNDIPKHTPIAEDEVEIEEDYGMSQDASFLADDTLNELMANMNTFNTFS
mmetsp:Transcript_854/g.2042  ORF Transcript_854/g.2042 Transcript_854/m.2042 type:complete len:180 (-) Transcript_854:209-748(-)|eukprot:CAMPEP_0172464668 /NCGR_PEP_ID=MMETSP1065-20121228/51129_1 /TAXON_ID=265537 /ORGANISM="Amphiprora paludosa, Strain CCMP125" /LENGTH=179 /DNA_ID=CAMNT_0013220963 /DNA_START=140 /DNA_END=679 /DNA_ORIENTATION=+